MPLKVGVVGCGVAGMASAIALARRGHEVTVLEAFDAPRAIGSGLLLQPTGLAALRSLGLEEQVRAAGARVDRLVGRDTRGRVVMDIAYSNGGDIHGLGIHRGVLFATLHEAMLTAGARVVTGARIVGLHDPARPLLEDEAGRPHGPFDLVLVADGSGSTLRPILRPRARAPVNRWGAVWCNAPDPDGRFDGALRQVYHRAEVMAGVLPVGRGPGAEGRQVSVFWSVPTSEFDTLTSGNFAAWRDQRLRALWPEAAGLLDGCAGWSAFNRAVYRDVSAGRWSDGVCALIGDAAHGTSPQLGQGANLGLIDAVELAGRLDRDNRPVAVAVRHWQAARRRHTGVYQLASRALTPLFQAHGAFWPVMRDLMFTPASRLPGLRRIAVMMLTGTLRLGRFPPETRP